MARAMPSVSDRRAAVDHSTVKKRELLPAAGSRLAAAGAASLTTALGGGSLTALGGSRLATSGLLAGRGSFLTASLATGLASAFLGGGLGRRRSGLLALAATATSESADREAAETDRQDHITKKLHWFTP
jgi:hypothetical protein